MEEVKLDASVVIKHSCHDNQKPSPPPSCRLTEYYK